MAPHIVADVFLFLCRAPSPRCAASTPCPHSSLSLNILSSHLIHLCGWHRGYRGLEQILVRRSPAVLDLGFYFLSGIDPGIGGTLDGADAFKDILGPHFVLTSQVSSQTSCQLPNMS